MSPRARAPGHLCRLIAAWATCVLTLGAWARATQAAVEPPTAAAEPSPGREASAGADPCAEVVTPGAPTEASAVVITIELWAEAVKGGIALHWELRNTSRVDELTLYRREARGPEERLVGWIAPTSFSGQWTDTAVRANLDYAYRLVADIGGSESSSGAAVVRMDPALLPRLGLEGASPNPFNPSTRIAFRLAQAETVQLRVYDGVGRCVRHLDLGTHGEGEGSAPWNGRDDQGRRVASGVYRVELLTPTQRDHLHVALVK